MKINIFSYNFHKINTGQSTIEPNEQPTQASRLFRNQIKPQHKNGNNISKYISWNPDKWNEQSHHEPNCIGISQYLYNCDIRRTAFGSQKK